MNIIIPLGGKGDRFVKHGYKEPKPLIPIFEKSMIFHVLDHLQWNDDDDVYIICYPGEVSKIVQNQYPKINIVYLQEQTSGASETLYRGLDMIVSNTGVSDKPVLLCDCDTFYTQDVIAMFRSFSKNAVFYTKNTDQEPVFSYIRMNSDTTNRIIEIAEKVKISDNANTGIYCFEKTQDLYQYAKHVVETNTTFRGECYTSCIIDKMIEDKRDFFGIEIDSERVFNLGTPYQLKQYLDQTFVFLFDLDGTLVLSEDVYYKVWTDILIEYNIYLTRTMFQEHISGNNDASVLQSFLPAKYTPEFLAAISHKKDALFLENIDRIIGVGGVVEMLKAVRTGGHPMAIVTNCNRLTSERILEHMGIRHYFEFIVVGNECDRAKPYPDPYLEAIRRFGTTKDRAIIFEDSKTGLLSANGASPRCIVGLETLYATDELKHYFADITMADYHDFCLKTVTETERSFGQNVLKQMICDSINIPIQDIVIETQKLKGGFISDVIKLDIVDRMGAQYPCVLKIENKNTNFLTKMSNELDLYQREYYFYDVVSKHVPLKHPRCHGIVRDATYANVGILMERLEYDLAVDLNQQPIETSFRILDRLIDMHVRFWNKPLQNLFSELRRHDDVLFRPKWGEFVRERWPIFQNKWRHVLSEEQIAMGEVIARDYDDIQLALAGPANLTLCHGDVKSANMFFEMTKDGYEPWFIDWQYIAFGKGVQDLVFFMIESFDADRMKVWKGLLKEYYYVKVSERGVKYDRVYYEKDFENAAHYFPFFVAMWFGTISDDELIDKNFPYFFIQRLFSFYDT